jgi:hypothetical protein
LSVQPVTERQWERILALSEVPATAVIPLFSRVP